MEEKDRQNQFQEKNKNKIFSSQENKLFFLKENFYVDSFFNTAEDFFL